MKDTIDNDDIPQVVEKPDEGEDDETEEEAERDREPFIDWNDLD